MSDADIKRMMAEAEANAETDKLRRESVEARNQAESVAYDTEKSLNEYKGASCVNWFLIYYFFVFFCIFLCEKFFLFKCVTTLCNFVNNNNK